ncbi:MAG: UvrD-helicase domain-containing protein [Microcoleaceae cyanobacterium]
MILVKEKPVNAATWRKKYRELFSWNKYQLNLFDAAGLQQDNISVNAVAGSGKTTSIKGVVAALPAKDKISICAFNRHIADKLKEDPCIPNRVSVNTAHGFGFALLVQFFGGNQPSVDQRKYYNIAKDLARTLVGQIRPRYEIALQQKEQGKTTEDDLKEQFGEIPPPYFDETSDKGRQNLKLFIRFIRDVAGFAMRTLYDTSDEALGQMIDWYDLESPDVQGASHWGIRAARRAIAIGEEIARNQMIINYDEMLFLPHLWNLTPWARDWLIVDEAQDASPAQISLYQKFVEQGAKIIYIGDPRQAIQGFAGADTRSWENLRDAFNPLDLPLSVCYRCPTTHINLAKKIVPQIEAAPHAIEGSLDVLHLEQLSPQVQPTDLILCRLTAPLISTCLKFIISGKPAIVRGRAIGEQLTSLATKAGCGENWPNQFLSNLEIYSAPIIQDLEGDETAQEQFKDRVMALRSLFKEFGKQSTCATFAEFCDRVESLFSDTDPEKTIILSTIHRAKGDEADRVFLLGSNFLPFLFKSTKDWQEQQEWNLVYVALTRAKKHLTFVPYPRSSKDKEKINKWVNDSLGGLELPKSQESGDEKNEINDDSIEQTSGVSPCRLTAQDNTSQEKREGFQVGDIVSVEFQVGDSCHCHRTALIERITASHIHTNIGSFYPEDLSLILDSSCAESF